MVSKTNKDWIRYIVIRKLKTAGYKEPIWGYWLKTPKEALKFKDTKEEEGWDWGYMSFSGCYIKVLNRYSIGDESPIKIEIIEKEVVEND